MESGQAISSEFILEILKYIGFVVTAVATIWSLVTKTTYEDENKQKHLTLAGQVAIGITVGSAVLSMMAFGFETLSKQNAAENASAQAARNAAAEARKEQARQIAQERIDEQRHRELEAQRYLILRNAADERTRQVDIATNVSRGAERNLTRTQLALEQIERAVYPLGLPTITVVLNLDHSTPGLEQLFGRLETFGRSLQNSPNRAADRPGIFVSSTTMAGIPKSFNFAPKADVAPNKDKEPEIYTLLYQTYVEVSLFDVSSGALLTGNPSIQNNARIGYFGNVGDFSFGIGDRPDPSNEPVKVEYDIETRRLSIWVTGKADERFTRRSGNVVSIQDLEKSKMVIAVDDTMVPSIERNDYPVLRSARRLLVPTTAFVEAAGRRYMVGGFQQIRRRSGLPMFIGRLPFGKLRDK